MTTRPQIDRNRSPFNLHPLFMIAIISCAVSVAAGGQEVGSHATAPVPVTFDSEGSTLHGVFYPANNLEPVATVLLLHGYPGNDKEPLGLGSRMMQEGINALAFNYRGVWASEGTFGPDTALQDIASAISYLSSPEVVETFAIDADNLFIAGYSFGGTMALIYSSQDPSIKRVVDIAGADLSEIARAIEKHASVRDFYVTFLDETMSESGMTRGDGGEAAVEWLLANGGGFDLVKVAGELADKDLLLIGGWLDADASIEGHILPLYRALLRHGAENVTIEAFADDHDFEVVRDALADRVISWIKEEATPVE